MYHETLKKKKGGMWQTFYISSKNLLAAIKIK